MSAAREQILAAVRAATAGEPAPMPPPAPPPAAPAGESEGARFLARAADLGASVSTAPEPLLAAAIAAALARHQVERLLIPAGLSPAWLAGEVETIRDEGLRLEEIDRADAVLTGCTLAIAETGTIALAGGGSEGRRAISLLPDLHVCVVYVDQVVPDVETAFSRLAEILLHSGPPVTLVSGPSATSDIELKRIVGVHGPRRLELILVDG